MPRSVDPRRPENTQFCLANVLSTTKRRMLRNKVFLKMLARVNTMLKCNRRFIDKMYPPRANCQAKTGTTDPETLAKLKSNKEPGSKSSDSNQNLVTLNSNTTNTTAAATTSASQTQDRIQNLNYFDVNDYPGVRGYVALTVDDCFCGYLDPDNELDNDDDHLETIENNIDKTQTDINNSITDSAIGVDIDDSDPPRIGLKYPKLAHTDKSIRKKEFKRGIVRPHRFTPETCKQRSWIKKVQKVLKETGDNSTGTFFCASDFCKNGIEEEIREFLNESGCELGSHMPEDRAYNTFSEEDFEQELIRCNKFLEEELMNYGGGSSSSEYKKLRWFRAPNGAISPTMHKVLQKHNLTHVMLDCFCFDTHIPEPRFIADQILKAIDHGSIWLCHMPEEGFREWNLEAMRLILEGLKKKGLKSVTVSELWDRAHGVYSEEDGGNIQKKEKINKFGTSNTVVSNQRQSESLVKNQVSQNQSQTQSDQNDTNDDALADDACNIEKDWEIVEATVTADATDSTDAKNQNQSQIELQDVHVNDTVGKADGEIDK